MRILYQVDAFTRTPLSGNPAGVVLDADSLSGTEMLALAGELANPETAFVLAADAVDHDVQVRFFTPTTEVPSCGHATIAAHFARAQEYGLPSSSLVQKTGGGLLQRVDIHRAGSQVRVGIHQGAATFGVELDDRRTERILKALGAGTHHLTGNGPVQVVSTGHSKILVELRDRSVIDGLRPDPFALTALSDEIGSNGFFVFTTSTGCPDLLTWSRMFAPAIGVTEDPVTGNGHGPLGAYLLRHGIVPAPDGVLTFKGRQGVVMGRPGDVRVRVRARPDGKVDVHISGDAVTVYRTRLNF
jgi:PhzF family phenazine biosynthesis protein